MGKYSIKELEKLSGIKAHTIRIWEKRHRLIEPQRTSTNIRFYSDDDLKKIINVSLLHSKGLKISRIANLNNDQLNQKVLELTETSFDTEVQINQLVIAMVDLDEHNFEKLLSGLILRYGFEQTVVQILYPFLQKIGVLWQTRHITPAQEHFISNLIRQKVIVAIDSLSLVSKDAKKVILFLPESELHEISLLFTHYRMRKAGYRTFYLGQAVPFDDLKSVYEVHKPDLLCTTITVSLSRISVQNYLEKLSKAFTNCRILVSGYQVLNYEHTHPNVTVLQKIEDLNPFLQP